MLHQYNEKQVQIIIVAERLFAEHGFNGASVRDIAHGASVNIAMISYYFGSKEKLLEAIFAYRIGTTTIQLEHLLAQKEISTLNKIYIMIDHYIEKMQNNTHFFKIMLSEQIKDQENKGLIEIIFNSKKKNFDLISALIAEGQKTGQFKKHIDISLLVSTLVGATNQMYIGQQYYKRLNQLEDMPDDKFQALFKKRMKLYLKNMFNAILTYEL
ncbi:MAG: TetR family transcriptional regulator [Phycisphaerales bacterium]|nr:TetR family transcriptional regulator [Phycisphaerales bacterium]